jgi:uncharacterized protein (TIRG00374 family)
MRRRLFSILQYIVFLGGGLFLVWWQLKSMSTPEKNEFYSSIKNADYRIIFPVALMSVLSHISRCLRWRLLMEPLHYHPRLSNLFAVTMIGYLANAAVPRLGEILKCTFLAKYEKLKVDKLVGTIIVERSFDLICYSIFIGITILIQIQLIGGYFKKKWMAMPSATGINLLIKFVVIFSSLFVIWKLMKWLARKNPQNNIILGINNFISGVGEGFKTIKKLKKRKLFLLHTVFIWTMYLGQIYVGFKGMDGTATLPISAAFSVLTLATLSMIVTPGGIGSFPIFVMQTLLLYGIHAPLGKAFGWVMWGVSTSLIIIIGLISLLIIPYLNKNSGKVQLN